MADQLFPSKDIGRNPAGNGRLEAMVPLLVRQQRSEFQSRIEKIVEYARRLRPELCVDAKGAGQQFDQFEGETGLQLPAFLRVFYRAVFGVDTLLKSRSRFLEPSRFAVEEEMLVFCKEVPGDRRWGIRVQDLPSEDPVVWQGASDGLGWHEETGMLTTFLINMCCWQATCSSPVSGRSKLEGENVTALRKNATLLAVPGSICSWLNLELGIVITHRTYAHIIDVGAWSEEILSEFCKLTGIPIKNCSRGVAYATLPNVRTRSKEK